ncbi:MAG: hypothetical protein ABIH23_05945 [bacterium]
MNKLILATIALSLLLVGCGNTVRNDVVMDNVGPVHFKLAGCYNMDAGSSVTVNASGQPVISGVQTPIGFDLISTAMSGAASIRITNASSVTFEVLATGNHHGKSYEAKSNNGVEHILIGENASELEDTR